MGKGKEGQRVSAGLESRKPIKTILIDGQLYDVTNFNHPGGSIIRFLTTPGGDQCVDATNAFKEFHLRTGEKASKYLKSLPKINGPYKLRFGEKENARRDAITRDYQKLREEFQSEGLFEPSLGHVVYRSAEIVALFFVSFYLLGSSNPLALVVGVIVNGIAQGRCGWLMHEAGHMSLTTMPRIDIRLQELTYGVGCGMSGGWWRSQHNRHHATPQKLKHDVDLDTLPLIAFNDKVATKVKPGSLQAKWLSVQAYVFAPVSCLLVGLFWTLFLHPRHVLRKGLKMEALWIAVRYVAWAAIMASLGYSAAQAFKLYLLCFGFGCTYIFTNFAVSHTHLDVTEPDEYIHWVEYAADHTTNVSCDSWFVTWFMSYLNMQIEHHLFPSCPQFNHPKIRHRVKEFFKKHNLKYDERPYLTALHDTFQNLNRVGEHAGKAKTM
jgi:fatty acid desaturase